MVETWHGSYDDTRSVLVGIWPTMGEAEKGREEYIMRLKKEQDRYPQEVRSRLEALIEEDKETEETKEYEYWKYTKSLYAYSEEVEITEVELGKILHKFE